MPTPPIDDARLRERAIARWEGEGGALSPHSGDDVIDQAALRLLARLGAALIESWDTIPAAAQPLLVERARTMGAPGDAARVADRLSRFLKDHCDDG